ncbi:Lethal (2) 35Be [Aphelenchoides bicaudatus]|nr:Lethal (2) 35Be [Aphelenchoides bicaudatus]
MPSELWAKIRDQKKNEPSMFVSGWEEDNQGILPGDLADPSEQFLLAAENGDIETMKQMQEIEIVSFYTPLHRTAYNNHVDACKWLLSVGANPELRTESGWTVLHSAACWAAYKIVGILLSHGVDVNSHSNGDVTPLHLAINSAADPNDQLITIKYLLSSPGIDMAAVNKAGETPLMLVVFYWVVNFAGVIYTTFVMTGVAGLNLFYTCPAIYPEPGGCFVPSCIAAVILVELILNLFLFHYYNKRNQVSYWTVKSSSLLVDDEAEQISQFDNVVDENQRLLGDEGCFVGARNDQPSVESNYSRSGRRGGPNSMTNGRLTITEDGVYRRETWVVDDQPKGPTKFCSECRRITPRRTHHCPLCDICVLRKDHHCMLTGGCVGLANQRYFIVFLFWAVVGSAYGGTYTFRYLNRFVTPWYPFGWVEYIGPIALGKWIFGHGIFFDVFLAMVFSAAVASSIAALGFFGAQMFYTLNGFTQHDYHVGRLRDQLESDGENHKERLALVFGKRWWLNFLIPQVWNSNQLTPSIARNIFLSVSKDL